MANTNINFIKTYQWRERSIEDKFMLRLCEKLLCDCFFIFSLRSFYNTDLMLKKVQQMYQDYLCGYPSFVSAEDQDRFVHCLGRSLSDHPVRLLC